MMYRIIDENLNPAPLSCDTVNYFIKYFPEEIVSENVSDGYHTFKELYAHRIALYIALIHAIHEQEYHPSIKPCWKSKLHSDGTMFDGWFISGIGLKKGDTLTYHLPISEWENVHCDEIENAPEWDGHTSEDVLKLLRDI